MTAFFDNTDLLSHMFGYITNKEVKQSATLVCKGWRELSDTFPTWRKARFYVKMKEGYRLDQVVKPGREWLGWIASRSAIKDMLTHMKHVSQYDLSRFL